jgi:hypothetical protein
MTVTARTTDIWTSRRVIGTAGLFRFQKVSLLRCKLWPGDVSPSPLKISNALNAASYAR